MNIQNTRAERNGQLNRGRRRGGEVEGFYVCPALHEVGVFLDVPV